MDVSPEEGLQKDTFEISKEEPLETNPSKDVSFSKEVKLCHKNRICFN